MKREFIYFGLCLSLLSAFSSESQAFEWPWETNFWNSTVLGRPPHPSEEFLRQFSNPIGQGMHAKVVITGYLNSIQCTSAWTGLNQFNHAFEFDSPTLFQADSSEHAFRAIIATHIGHTRVQSHQMVEDGLFWNVFNAPVAVNPLRQIQLSSRGVVVQESTPQWVETSYVQEFHTPGPVDTQGTLLVEVGRALGVDEEHSTYAQHQWGTQIEVPYNLSSLGNATATRESNYLSLPLNPGENTTPCFHGWVQISKNKTQWWQ